MLQDIASKNKKIRSSMLVIRVSDEQKALVEQAAEREGLQVSSFIIMLLVRFHVLPDICLETVKRRPVAFFTALHGLLGVVNKIGGNCKQLADAFPDVAGLHHAHAEIIAAAAAITDALHGKRMAQDVNLYRLQDEMTNTGHVFNQIVKSVNSGRPNLARLPDSIQAIAQNAAAVTIALNGTRPMKVGTGDMLSAMRMAAKELTQRQDYI